MDIEKVSQSPKNIEHEEAGGHEVTPEPVVTPKTWVVVAVDLPYCPF